MSKVRGDTLECGLSSGRHFGRMVAGLIQKVYPTQAPESVKTE